jgi:hypothetical protein
MAIYNAGYLSPIRKKLGNAVGRKWRTLDVLAVYQPFVSNPNTEAQRLVRTRFGAAASLSNVFKRALLLGFAGICKGTKVPERSMFIRKNWECIHADTPGAATVDYTEIKIAEGSLPEVLFGNASFAEPLQVAVPMSDTTGIEGADAHDKVYIFAYSPEAGAGVISDGRNTRADESISVNVPAYWNGHRVHVWGFTIGNGIDNKGVISNSRYLGSGTIS